MPIYINNTYIYYFVDIVDILNISPDFIGLPPSTILSTEYHFLLTLLTVVENSNHVLLAPTVDTHMLFVYHKFFQIVVNFYFFSSFLNL